MPVFKTPIKMGEDNPIDAVPELTEEEKNEIARRMQILDQALFDKQVGKYKIEIMFESRRTPSKPAAGALYVMENGKMLHGGGDVAVFFCPGKRQKVNDCESVIPSTSSGYGFQVCAKCGKTWKVDETLQGTRGRHSMQDWAKIIMKYFYLLEGNADIYIKQPLLDIRKASAEEQERELRGDKLEKARAKRVKLIYPFKNIVRDLSAGADLYSRLMALLTA